jgi:hypothetical protein
MSCLHANESEKLFDQNLVGFCPPFSGQIKPGIGIGSKAPVLKQSAQRQGYLTSGLEPRLTT